MINSRPTRTIGAFLNVSRMLALNTCTAMPRLFRLASEALLPAAKVLTVSSSVKAVMEFLPIMAKLMK